MKNEKKEKQKLLKEKNKLLDQLNKERQEKERLEKKIIEEEGRKQINQLSSGLNKEQQLIESSEKGYIYAIKKLLKEGVNINAKDSSNYKRRRYKDGQH